MFPTVVKTKISSGLAYPASAKLISEALCDVPQAQELSISFLYWRSTARIHEYALSYPVMAVDYSYHKASQYTPHDFEARGMNQPKWTIWVQPVRATLKHRVKELLQQEALPKISDWLVSKRDISGKQGNHSFTVWYDEETDELKYV